MTDNKVRRRTVYCLTKKIPDENYDMYVGSTCKPLSKRLSHHKNYSKKVFIKDSKFYKRLREVGPDNWCIKPLLVHTCSKKDIRHFENKWIEILNADLNEKSPIQDDQTEKHRISKIRKRNIDEKKYYCDVCEKAFQSNSNLNQHRDSLKHQYAYLNSLD